MCPGSWRHYQGKSSRTTKVLTAMCTFPMPLERGNFVIYCCIFHKCCPPFRTELQLERSVNILTWQLQRFLLDSIRFYLISTTDLKMSIYCGRQFYFSFITLCSLMMEGSQFTHRGCDKGDSGFDLIYIDITGLQQLVMLAPDPGARSLIWAKYR